jgi:hypothetical protein
MHLKTVFQSAAYGGNRLIQGVAGEATYPNR